MNTPKDVSDDMLMALADDELNTTEAAALRRVIAADAVLAARYAVFLDTRHSLRAAFPPEPVPARLLAAAWQGAGSAGAETGVLPFAPRSRPARSALAPPGWLALAASLLLAVGAFWVGRGSAPDTVVAGDATVQAAMILSGRLTGEAVQLPDSTTARVLASFDTDLGLCRLIGVDGARHLTCRGDDADGWVTALSVATGEVEGYLPASDVINPVIDQMLDAIGAGPNLAPEEEARALGL
jgi:hypothetical protein